MHKVRISLIRTFFFLAVLIGGLGWMIYTPVKHERLNHALIAAIKQNDTKQALALLNEGADPNSRDEPPQHLSFWRLLLHRLRGNYPGTSTVPTALLLACSWDDIMRNHGHLEETESLPPAPDNPILVKALLDRGAALEVKDTDQRTPLFWAAARDKTQVCALLIKRGAKVNTADKRGITPLMLAARRNNKVLVSLLINKQADVNAVGYTLFGSCLTPLIEAQWTQEDDPAITEMLLSCGAKVNGPDLPLAEKDMTPLFAAVQGNQIRKVRILLQHGADVNAQVSSGSSPFVDANLTGEHKILQMLKQAGAKE